MHKNSTKKVENQQRNRVLPSKPSKQSLVARGLAVDEKSASKRILLSKNPGVQVQKPGFNLYYSSDSDADQVYSTTKKLDRCASLLANILEEKENVPKKKTNLKTKPNQMAKKGEKKKVVKIILPTNHQSDVDLAKGVTKTVSRTPRMITSTPTSHKIKTTNNKENELKKQLSQIEQEKQLLQEQYSSLLEKHLNTPISQPAANSDEKKRLSDIPEKDEISHPYRTQQFPSKYHPNSESNIPPTENHQLARIHGFSREPTGEEKGSIALPIFKELENTINKISDKLTFPGSLTPSSNRSTLTDSKSSMLSGFTPSLSRLFQNSYQVTDDLSSRIKNYDEADIGYDGERSNWKSRYNSQPYTSSVADNVEPRKIASPMERLSDSTQVDSTLPATSLYDFSTTDDRRDSLSLQSSDNDQSVTTADESSDEGDKSSLQSPIYDRSVTTAQAKNDHRDSLNILSPDPEMTVAENELSAEETLSANTTIDDAEDETGSNSVESPVGCANIQNSEENKTKVEKTSLESRNICRGKETILHAEINQHVATTNEARIIDEGVKKSQKARKSMEDDKLQIGKKAKANQVSVKEIKKAKDLNIKGDKSKARSKNIGIGTKGQRKIQNEKTNKTEMKKFNNFHTASKEPTHDDRKENLDEQNSGQLSTEQKDVNRPNYFVSPNGKDNKPLIEVTSQLASLKNGMNPVKIVNSNKPCLQERPGYAATQITMLSYLFKELITLLGEKLNSEEGRLLTEIDHIIGLLPFVMNNLNPDLQTEINLAVQPLRVENSDLRRQLRIANQKMRDFQAHTDQLRKELTIAKKKTIDQGQLEKLKNQIDFDGDQRKAFIEKIADVTKTIEELKLENKNLVQKVANKDTEDVHNIKQLQKEKNALSSENILLTNKIESLSLNLQAHEKENKILKLSISQSEAEIARVKELNRGLQESVAKLLRDVNFKDTRSSAISRSTKTANVKTNLNQINREIALPTRENAKIRDTGSAAVDNKRRFTRPVINDKQIGLNDNSKPRDNCVLTKAVAQPYRRTTDAIRHFAVINNRAKAEQLKKNFVDLRNIDSDLSSDIASEALSSTVDSESKREGSVRSITSCSDLDADSVISIDDRYSTLTCDSGEFQLDLANLDADIKKMQRSLQSAKTN